jgi:hypothetical protein
MQLSFNYESNTVLQEKYLTGNDDFLSIFEGLAHNTSLSLDAKSKVNILYNRLTKISTLDTVTSTAQVKHVMLSYSWDKTAKPELVKAFGSELRRLGYDVWRDEEGSLLVPPLTVGSVDDRMAMALQASDTVIVFVSPSYKISANCRLEASYASVLSKRGQVKIVFVMMDEKYTTVSAPEYCDGWLGALIMYCNSCNTVVILLWY